MASTSGKNLKGKLKQPHEIAMADDAQMVMAGLWAKWKSPTSGEEVLSCTILTCEPNNATIVCRSSSRRTIVQSG
jgi:putative SOS response-associated peptidase YedK